MLNVSVEHIELDEKGTARVAGTRSPVINIVLDAKNGLTAEQIHQQYPHLSMAQIHAALAYYYDHQRELDATIDKELHEVEQLRANSDLTPNRAELVARLGSRREPNSK